MPVINPSVTGGYCSFNVILWQAFSHLTGERKSSITGRQTDTEHAAF